MLVRSRVALAFLLFGLAFHAYLAWHFYPIQFGFGAGEMQCNLNSTFNCDAATASAYSQILGVPIALIGAMANLVMVLFILGSLWRLTEAPEKYLRWAFYLSGFSVIISIIMAGISAALIGSYCLFCILIYATYVGAFVALKKGNSLKQFKEDLGSLQAEVAGIIPLLAIVPVGTFLFHQALLSYYGGSEVKKFSLRAISEWKSNPQVIFDQSSSLNKGADPKESSGMTVVEFADFRCHHCAKAAPALKAFASAYADVRVQFFNFPLDGKCNPSLGENGDGISCRLAKWVHCTGQIDQKAGWKIHDELFEHQEKYGSLRQESLVDEQLGALAKAQGLESEKILSCVNSEATQNAIVRQSRIGELAQVDGTPAIFVNGRKLPSGQVISILKAARSEILTK